MHRQKQKKVMKRKSRQKAIVRAFDLILTFDSDKLDNELEDEITRLLAKINRNLLEEFKRELPQIEFDSQSGKKKMKIGITPVIGDVEDDEDSELD